MSTAFRFSLRVLEAGHGDCMIIDYGRDGDMYRVVVDGGTASTYKRLERALLEAPGVAHELLVVTHVDADHIAGVLRLVKSGAVLQSFRDVWFNGRKHLEPDGAQPFGARQGDKLTEAMERLGVPWNRAFAGGAVRLADGDSPLTVDLGGGARITLLSPRGIHLQMLRHRWDLEVKSAGMAVDDPVAVLPVVPPGLERLGLGEIDVARLAAKASAADTSIPNATSIAFLFEFGGRTLLMGADAHADVVVRAGKKLGGGKPIPVDVLKLPHHGSESNVNNAVLQQFPARSFVISTNGDYHGHPDDAALARIVTVIPEAKLLFNYDCEAFQRWSALAARDGSRFTTECGQAGKGLLLNLGEDAVGSPGVAESRTA